MQQIPFIDLFKSALHISGDKLAHLQEYVLTVYTAFGTMHRYCCRPVTLSPVGSGRCVLPKLYIQSKSAPEDGRVCRPKYVEQIKRDQ